jgi:hypothetical protein
MLGKPPTTAKKTEMIDRLEILNIQLEALKREIKGSRKYFHLNTVRNFIIHFEELPNEKAKGWIFEDLCAYFIECGYYLNSIDRDISHVLYFKYLDKISIYYHDHVRFTLYPGFILILLILIVFTIVLKLFFFNWLYSILFGVFCFVTYSTYLIRKKKNKRTFGFFH